MSLLRNEILATCIKFGVLIFLKKVCLEHFVFCRNIIKTKFFPDWIVTDKINAFGAKIE